MERAMMAQMTTMIHPLMTLSKLYFLPTEQQLAPWQVAGLDNTDTIAPSVLELHILRGLAPSLRG